MKRCNLRFYIRRMMILLVFVSFVFVLSSPVLAAEVSSNTWIEIDFSEIKSGQSIAITMDRDGVTYALSNKSVQNPIIVSVDANSFVSSSLYLGWTIRFNDGGSFRLYSDSTDKFLYSVAGDQPGLTFDDSHHGDWFIYKGYLTIDLGSYYSMIIRDNGKWDDMKSSSSPVTSGDCSNLRFWVYIGNRTYIDLISNSLSIFFGWIGLVISSLFVEGGEFYSLFSYVLLPISIVIIFVFLKIKDAIWGRS